MTDHPDIEHEYWDVNGISMHVAVAGSGPPLILLHGFPEIWYSWRNLIPRLAKDFRVIAPDLRGYGKTEITKKGYDLITLGNDVKALIDIAGEPACLVGHDWGGVIGWHVASAHPDSVKAYLTVAGPHPARYWEIYMTNLRQALMGTYVLFFQIPWLPEWLLSSGRGRALRRMMKSTAIRREAITREDLEEYQKTWTLPRVRAGINYYRALFRRPRWALKFHRERKIQCPVCVVWADKDMALSLIQTTGLERYCQNPPEVRVIENCGHWIQQEAPDELYEIMAGFFKNNGN